MRRDTMAKKQNTDLLNLLSLNTLNMTLRDVTGVTPQKHKSHLSVALRPAFWASIVLGVRPNDDNSPLNSPFSQISSFWPTVRAALSRRQKWASRSKTIIPGHAVPIASRSYSLECDYWNLAIGPRTSEGA